MAKKDETEKQDGAPSTELADPIAALRAEFAKQLEATVAKVQAESKKQLDAAREETLEAHDRIDRLQRQLADERERPAPGGIGDALKELVSQLKSKDALAADEHAKVKAENHAKRVGIFEKTKKTATHVFYKLHAPAYLNSHQYNAGEIVSLPLQFDEDGTLVKEHPKHLPGIGWRPVADKVVTTELAELPEESGRAADQDPAAA